jgi:hypothetical protein
MDEFTFVLKGLRGQRVSQGCLKVVRHWWPSPSRARVSVTGEFERMPWEAFPLPRARFFNYALHFPIVTH